MKLSKYLYFLLFVVFCLLGLNSYIFERSFYFNEVLAIGGASIMVYQFFLRSKKGHVRIPKSFILRCMLGLLILCIVHLFVSLYTKTNFYYYFRNSVIFYSMFSFFIGFYGVMNFHAFLNLIKLPLKIYLLIGLVFPNPAFLDRFTTALFFPLLFKKIGKFTLVAITGLYLVLSKQYESMTVVLITVMVMGIILLPSYKVFKWLVSIASVAIVSGLIYYSSNFELYKKDPYSLFGNTDMVIVSSPVLSVDANTTWRAIFWYRIAKERFPENLVGIGFGTPLLPYIPGLKTEISEHSDEHDVHVSGSHNTYLTVALRLGLPFVFFMVLIFRQVFKEFYNHHKYYNQENQLIIFVSFFSIAVIGLFNLLLETPLGASLFWVLLGLVAGAIENRKSTVFSRTF